MDSFIMEIAGFVFSVTHFFGSTQAYCAGYLSDREPDYAITVSWNDLVREQELLDLEADEEGLKRRKFSDMFLERSVIQRRVAENLLHQNVILMHGSTVAVDGKAYLFTGSCGTGKSTHTRLWREMFGDRAVMVNDDKPFLRFESDGIFVYGSPWTGKHGLGSNVRAKLKGICLLRRGPINKVWRTESEDVRAFIRHQCFLSEEVPEQVEELFRRVPVWEMECTKEPEAASVAFAAMSNV